MNVPSLTGAVMCMGVATANSILMVSFARDRMRAGIPAVQSALEAGYTRIRPVLMTALAMIIGMLPMSLGLGEGGEQNAPLGRAVIGGLLFATVATLFFVPSVFAIIHGRREAKQSCSSHKIWKTVGDQSSVHRSSAAEEDTPQYESRDDHAPPEITPPPKLRQRLRAKLCLSSASLCLRCSPRARCRC